MAPGNALTPRLTAPRPDAAVPPQRTTAPPPTAADLRRFAFELPARAESVAHARGLVTDRLGRWGTDPGILDAAELVVSELFTNAVLHTVSSRVVCEVRDRGDRLRLAVHDEGRPVSTPRPAEAEECGRGLLIVDAVCSAWGAHDARHGAGRVVWAELTHDRAEPC
ncbi:MULTISPECIES: anti-sigma regulatory factor [unclassified Streptomyces]|uniref:ATP-binding protein n=1 Tax=unclassified Streptomyces TaxID=2593676 RepID=UPI001F44D9BC|nr:MULTISPECIES: ATP-binding protein [unclassified Streptomyces]